jgi:Amiloride-sensitive sodium channel
MSKCSGFEKEKNLIINFFRRQCYFEGEKSLKYFKIYSKSSCDQECFSNASLSTCGCVPFYLISNVHVENIS